MNRTTLQDALHNSPVSAAYYEWDGYTVYISENNEGSGYDLTVQKEAMPPHVTKLNLSLGQVEAEMNDTLNYKAGSAVWMPEEEGE